MGVTQEAQDIFDALSKTYVLMYHMFSNAKHQFFLLLWILEKQPASFCRRVILF
jgi:hypothetical protein